MRIQASRRALLVVALAMTGLVGTEAHASAPPAWAPAATAPIHPGVQTRSPIGQCTANFVFWDTNHDIYIGQAAHCTSTSGATTTNGCVANSLPLGTKVSVGGATVQGTMVYNSWLAMKAAGENPNSAQCMYNDFALVKLDPVDYGRVNPSVPFWGGPVSLNTAGAASWERVYSYGNSSLRFGITTLSPKTGIKTATRGGGWSHSVYTATPGIPGDSGSAFLDKSGNALGVLATLSVDGSNGVGDMSRELTYARTHGMSGLELALGTEAFNPRV